MALSVPSLFFYGTLRHLPLLEIVLGRPLSGIKFEKAVLRDYTALSVTKEPFPAIVAKPGAFAEGLLVTGLGEADLARILFYEGSFDYDLVSVTLEGGQAAQVFLPTVGRWRVGEAWDLATWETDWSLLSCHAAQEVMGYYGIRTRAEVDAMFPMIRARAMSRVNAAQSLHGAGLLCGKVNIASQARVYSKFYALDEIQLSHERFDGRMSPVLDRAVFVPVDAALVLPYDPVRDRVLLVEQMRMGPLARGDKTVWQLEPVAGRIDPGETPEQAAQREAQEEAGLQLSKLINIAQVYASPGNSSEFYYIFIGLCEIPNLDGGVSGLETENEDIRSHILSFGALMDLCDSMQAANSPLVLAAYWLARHRERLRLEHGAATS